MFTSTVVQEVILHRATLFIRTASLGGGFYGSCGRDASPIALALLLSMSPCSLNGVGGLRGIMIGLFRRKIVHTSCLYDLCGYTLIIPGDEREWERCIFSPLALV